MHMILPYTLRIIDGHRPETQLGCRPTKLASKHVLSTSQVQTLASDFQFAAPSASLNANCNLFVAKVLLSPPEAFCTVWHVSWETVLEG